MTLTVEQAKDIRDRETALRSFLGTRTSYRSEEVAHLNPPTNEERDALELFEFQRDKPERYFLYIDQPRALATTWMGDKLGTVHFGRQFHDSFGGTRVPVTIHAITGDRYHGTYFKSSGDYARIRKARGTK